MSSEGEYEETEDAPIFMHKIIKLVSGETIVTVAMCEKTSDLSVDEADMVILIDPLLFTTKYIEHPTKPNGFIEEMQLTEWFKHSYEPTIEINEKFIIGESNASATIVDYYTRVVDKIHQTDKKSSKISEDLLNELMKQNLNRDDEIEDNDMYDDEDDDIEQQQPQQDQKLSGDALDRAITKSSMDNSNCALSKKKDSYMWKGNYNEFKRQTRGYDN